MKKITTDRKNRRKRRVSLSVTGSAKSPRIAVFRSNRNIYAQAIDDEKRVTLASFSTLNLKKDARSKKTEEATVIGHELGKILKGKKIVTAVFDRAGYRYSGRVAKLCDGLREAGIKI